MRSDERQRKRRLTPIPKIQSRRFFDHRSYFGNYKLCFVFALIIHFLNCGLRHRSHRGSNSCFWHFLFMVSTSILIIVFTEYIFILSHSPFTLIFTKKQNKKKNTRKIAVINIHQRSRDYNQEWHNLHWFNNQYHLFQRFLKSYCHNYYWYSN